MFAGVHSRICCTRGVEVGCVGEWFQNVLFFVMSKFIRWRNKMAVRLGCKRRNTCLCCFIPLEYSEQGFIPFYWVFPSAIFCSRSAIALTHLITGFLVFMAVPWSLDSCRLQMYSEPLTFPCRRRFGITLRPVEWLPFNIHPRTVPQALSPHGSKTGPTQTVTVTYHFTAIS